MGEKGEGFSGTTIKDTWTKPEGGVESGEGGGDGWDGGVVVRAKCRQLYLNNNKIKKESLNKVKPKTRCFHC